MLHLLCNLTFGYLPAATNISLLCSLFIIAFLAMNFSFSEWKIESGKWKIINIFLSLISKFLILIYYHSKMLSKIKNLKIFNFQLSIFNYFLNGIPNNLSNSLASSSVLAVVITDMFIPFTKSTSS